MKRREFITLPTGAAAISWQAAKFDFVLNLKTAKALGIAVPMAFWSEADEAIE